MVMKTEASVIWVKTSCDDAVGYQHFGEMCYLHHHSEISKTLQNVAILTQHYMVS
jgi:hypothetical protein